MPPAFPINLRFHGGLSATQQDIFFKAAARWQRIIVAPLPKVAIGSVVTEGVIIDAQGVRIDGPRGILGQAGATRIRPGTMGAQSFLPCAGVMSFDSDDLVAMEAAGTMLDVIIHEMGHVLGIGTSWMRKMRLLNAGSANPTFNGPKASLAYATLRQGPLANVPVENMGGAGTRDSHWRERVFASELMTGYVSSAGVANPISRMTVASLADLGYTVDLNAADPFALPLPAVMAEMGPPVLKPHCLPIIPFPA